MPVYNAEKTVGRMLESIIAQTIAEWEIVAVDDGSTDLSGRILDEYAAKDLRIRVVHKSNGGVASARQEGVTQAKGKWTIHADSDDYVEPAMLEEMVAFAEENDADMVIADYMVEKTPGKSLVVKQEPYSLKAIDILYQIYAKGLFGGLCHKLLRAAIYDKAQARFISGIDYCEDQLLLTQILVRIPDLRIGYLPKAYYHYVTEGESLTRGITTKKLENVKRFNETFPKYLPNESRFDDAAEEARLSAFILAFTNDLFEGRELKQEFVKVKKIAFKHPSLRWRIGFRCLSWGMAGLAHKLLKF